MLERHSDIRLVFTDIDMPGSMNGLRLSPAVRDRWPPVKIIATSGHFRVQPGDLPADARFTNPRKLSVLFVSLTTLRDGPNRINLTNGQPRELNPTNP